jgi:hypothetical protein
MHSNRSCRQCAKSEVRIRPGDRAKEQPECSEDGRSAIESLDEQRKKCDATECGQQGRQMRRRAIHSDAPEAGLRIRIDADARWIDTRRGETPAARRRPSPAPSRW